MQQAASWITPLLLLSGVGLLVTSTANRYASVHAEIHRLLEEGGSDAAVCASHALKRARLFRSALVVLYLGAATLGSAGLVGALTQWLLGELHELTWALSAFGVLAIVVASVQLCREAILSLNIIKMHTREISERADSKPH